MQDDGVFWMLIGIIILSGLLVVASSATLGRKLADIEYQRAARINGVLRIQAYINARTHGNRVYMGVVFLTSSILSLLPTDPEWRLSVTRVLLLSMLGSYTVASILDWIDEHRIMQLQLRIMQPLERSAYSSVPAHKQAEEGVSHVSSNDTGTVRSDLVEPHEPGLGGHSH